MAKNSVLNADDDALLAELGIEIPVDKTKALSPLHERVIAGFEEISRFVTIHQRRPQLDADRDIFERIYAVRLQALRMDREYHDFLIPLDQHQLLSNIDLDNVADLDDDALLEHLGVLTDDSTDSITQLKHVQPRSQIRAEAEMIAQRTPCAEFSIYQPLFTATVQALKLESMQAMPLISQADIALHDWFILNGQLSYIADIGDTFINDDEREDMRLKVIFDNGTQSNLLMRSLQKALLKDEAARRVITRSEGPLFETVIEEDDLESGTIYVLRSLSEQPQIKQHAHLLHKIGVTGGSVRARIANAKHDATFLLSEVEVVASYELYNIHRTKLEQLLHKFFDSARLELELLDRFGQTIKPREWFLVPLFVIDEVVMKLKQGALLDYRYDVQQAKLVKKL